MSVLLNIIRAEACYSGYLFWDGMQILARDNGVLFTNRIGNRFEIDVDMSEKDYEHIDGFTEMIEHEQKHIHYLQGNDMASVVCALLFNEFIRDVYAAAVVDRVSVKDCGNSMFAFTAPWNVNIHVFYSANFNVLCYSCIEHENDVWRKFKECAYMDDCISVLNAIPIMCNASGNTALWENCKDMYRYGILEHSKITRFVLKNYAQCKYSVDMFKKVEFCNNQSVRDKMKVLSKRELYVVAAGHYRLFKLGSAYALLLDTGVVLHTCADDKELIKALDHALEDSVPVVPVASANAVDQTVAYLNKCSIATTTDIVVEIDRLLKLSGNTRGIATISDVLADL